MICCWTFLHLVLLTTFYTLVIMNKQLFHFICTCSFFLYVRFPALCSLHFSLCVITKKICLFGSSMLIMSFFLFCFLNRKGKRNGNHVQTQRRLDRCWIRCGWWKLSKLNIYITIHTSKKLHMCYMCYKYVFFLCFLFILFP